jgi:hypothetical protein
MPEEAGNSDQNTEKNDALLKQFCQAVGLSQTETARILNAKADEPAERSTAK